MEFIQSDHGTIDFHPTKSQHGCVGVKCPRISIFRTNCTTDRSSKGTVCCHISIVTRLTFQRWNCSSPAFQHPVRLSTCELKAIMFTDFLNPLESLDKWRLLSFLFLCSVVGWHIMDGPKVHLHFITDAEAIASSCQCCEIAPQEVVFL